MEVITLNAASRDTTKETISFYLDQIEKDIVTRAPSQSILNFGCGPSPSQLKKRGLVIDGRTLNFALDKKLEKHFLSLAEKCTTVLCCRTTPLQKASVVKLVKEHLHALTLAVGDGANDVSMIQTADIGIGISGQEGMQAVMASDFSMARFKYLERLLLVHGHWCYDRLARMVLYFFYKNAAFIFVLFWFQFFNGFTGLVMIDQFYLILYNLIFTSLPPIIMGTYDQDISAEVLLSKPELFQQGSCSKVYKKYSFWINMADALYQSLIIFFINYGAYIDGDSGMWVFGSTVTTCCVLIQLGHLGLEVRSWTCLHILSIIFSLLLYFGFSLGYSGIFVTAASPSDPYWVTEYAMITATFWLVLLLTFVTALLPRFTIRAFLNSVHPSLVVQVHLDVKKSLVTDSASEYIATWSSSTSTSSIMKNNGPINSRIDTDFKPNENDTDKKNIFSGVIAYNYEIALSKKKNFSNLQERKFSNVH